MENKKRVIEIIIFVLIISNAFFALSFFFNYKELQNLKANQSQIVLNAKVVNFTEMFIGKVLQANTEVDFETRLTLENSVRDLRDEEIMSEWQNFTGAKTEAEAQASVKKLLGILINKIQK